MNDFGWALARLREGRRVRRAGWASFEFVQLSRDGRKILDEDGATPTIWRDVDAILATDWEEHG